MAWFLVFVGFTGYMIYEGVKTHCNFETRISEYETVKEYLGK